MGRFARRYAVWSAVGVLALVATIVAFQLGPATDREGARLADLVGLRPGMVVAEIGAGNGAMAIYVARRLGSSGRVFATEIGAEKLRAIRDAGAGAGLTNITVLEGGEHSTMLPDGCCDLIYMRRVYHHLSDPAEINKSLSAALRPGGRLVVIDQLLALPFFHHGLASDVIARQVTAAGFVLDRFVPRWSLVDYCLIFAKPAPHASQPSDQWAGVTISAATANSTRFRPFFLAM